MAKDEELRTLLRKRGYKILELYYDSYSDKKRDQLYDEILDSLGMNVWEDRLAAQLRGILTSSD